MKDETIGILGAIKDEISWIFPLLKEQRQEKIGNRKYYIGKLNNKNIVASYSGYGKVASSLTATTLITKHNVDLIIFVGVAGALKKLVSIGDIVIGKNFYQHDVSASPTFKKFMLPFQKTPFIKGNDKLIKKAKAGVEKFLTNPNFKNLFSQNVLNDFNIKHPKLFIEDITSSDKAVLKKDEKLSLAKDLPSAFAVDMEGGAISQVCEDFSTPFVIIRVISDDINSSDNLNLKIFLTDLTSVYFKEIITYLLEP